MTEEELLKLIPFYAAGTLETEEKNIVEQQLVHLKSLQEELAFWRNARHATISYVAYLNEGHPASEALVDYAERAFNGQRSRLIDEHLASCRNCKEEFDTISQTFRPAAIPEQQSGTQERRFADLFRLVKPAYVLSAAALLALLFFLLRPRPPSQTVSTISFVLPYQQTLRGIEHPEQQHFSLASGITSVDLTLVIPHNSIMSADYAIFIKSPNRPVIQHPGKLSIVKGSQFDSLKAMTARSFFPEDGLYEITVKELLPDSLHGITAEEYTYAFTISGL